MPAVESQNEQRSHLNNFDLIRLAAATQVAIVHGVEHIGLRLPFHETTLAVLNCFPGVPIFFVLSGFLIASSYERNSLTDFARARALRIFPALWICLALSVLSVWASGYFSANPPPAGVMAAWLAGQATIVQFFNPDFMRAYGVGVLNGSLWTIPVELQFYVLAPLVVLLFRRKPTLFWSALIILAIVNLVVTQMPPSMLRKFILVTCAPWIYMFMLGVALQFLWPRVKGFFEGRVAYWAAAYAAVVALNVTIGIGASTNNILLPYVLLLAGLLLSAGYSAPHLANMILRRTDISYGLYIGHLPVYNFMLYKGLDWGWAGVAISFAFALASWKLIERPALRMKAGGRRSIAAKSSGVLNAPVQIV